MSEFTEQQREMLGAIPANWGQPPKGMITKLNRGKGVVLDYVGHADVTLILCEVDPCWGYDWNRDESGNMAIRKSGQNLVLEGSLTIHGVTRPCVGTCQSNKGEPEKELTGDLIRNGAMRFGIGTKLWSKLDDATDDHVRKERAPADEVIPLMNPATIESFIAKCDETGVDHDEVMALAFPDGVPDPLRAPDLPAMRAAFTKLEAGKAVGRGVVSANEVRPAVRAQVGAIKGKYKELGIEDREMQLTETAALLEYAEPPASHNALSFDEASKLLEMLSEMLAGK